MKLCRRHFSFGLLSRHGAATEVQSGGRHPSAKVVDIEEELFVEFAVAQLRLGRAV